MRHLSRQRVASSRSSASRRGRDLVCNPDRSTLRHGRGANVKIVVDAMCAEFGGIRTYVDHLLGHWSNVHPEDELHVVVPRGSTLDTADHTRHELRVRRPGVLGRPWPSRRPCTRLIKRRLRPDAVLATVPSTTVRRLKAPLGRGHSRPASRAATRAVQRARRLLRKVSYERTYALADGFLAISHRSLDDLHALHPETVEVPAEVTYLGADHVLDWPTAARARAVCCIRPSHQQEPGPDPGRVGHAGRRRPRCLR